MPRLGKIVYDKDVDQNHRAAKEMAALPDYCNSLINTLLSTAFYHRGGLTNKDIPRFGEYKFTENSALERITIWNVEVRGEDCVIYELHVAPFIQEAGLVKAFCDIVSSHLELYYPDCKVLLGHVLPPCQFTIRVEKKT